MNASRSRISIIVPLYNEEGVLPLFIEELRAETAGLGDVEIILVDDGSTDRTPDIIKGLADRHPEIRYIRLSRNYGHQMALLAGMEAATGDCAVMMDGDLQHPPKLVPLLVEKWREGYHIFERVSISHPGSYKSLGALIHNVFCNDLKTKRSKRRKMLEPLARALADVSIYVNLFDVMLVTAEKR